MNDSFFNDILRFLLVENDFFDLKKLGTGIFYGIFCIYVPFLVFEHFLG